MLRHPVTTLLAGSLLLAVLASCGTPKGGAAETTLDQQRQSSATREASVDAQPTVEPVQPTPVASRPAEDDPAAPQATWPGEGWREAEAGDYNGNGVADTIFYKPSQITPQDWFNDDYLNQVSIVVAEMFIAEQRQEGPFILLRVTPAEVQAHDKSIAILTSDPAAYQADGFLMALDSGSGVFLSLLPLKADGTAYGQALGINWFYGEQAFRLINA